MPPLDQPLQIVLLLLYEPRFNGGDARTLLNAKKIIWTFCTQTLPAALSHPNEPSSETFTTYIWYYLFFIYFPCLKPLFWNFLPFATKSSSLSFVINSPMWPKSSSLSFATTWPEFLLLYLEKSFGDISPFSGATDTPVLDFWWRLLWVSKSGWILSLACFVTCVQWIPQIHR